MKAAARDAVYRQGRNNPAWQESLNEALDAMFPGGTYTITAFKNLRHRTVSGELMEMDDQQVVLSGGKVSIEDIVRITCPKEQLEF